MSQDKLLYLESLRGVAALAVALFHCSVASPLTDNHFINNSWLMVDFFFVLSGFVIALNYQDRLSTLADVTVFQRRRFLRLYPLHIVTLLVFLGIEIAKFAVERGLGLEANNAAFSVNNVQTFATNVFLLQGLFSDGLTWNHPSWSVSAEFYTYILFAALTLILTGKRKLYLVACAVISGASFVYLLRNGMDISNGFMRCLFSFFLGALLYNASASVNFKLPRFVASGIIVAAIVLLSVRLWSADVSVSLLFPFMFAMIIFALHRSKPGGLTKSILENDRLVYLGTISYGVYLIHAAVWWCVAQIVRFGLRFPTEIDATGREVAVVTNPLVGSVFVILSIAAVIGLAHLSYRHLETPFLLADRRQSRAAKPMISSSAHAKA